MMIVSGTDLFVVSGFKQNISCKEKKEKKDSRSMISSTGNDVLCHKDSSFLSLPLATLMARSTDILENRETTSNDTSNWSASRY